MGCLAAPGEEGRRCVSSDIHFLSTCQIPFEILLDTLKQEPRPSWSPICHSEGVNVEALSFSGQSGTRD